MKFLKDNGLVIGLICFIGLLLFYLGFVKGELKTRDDMIDRYSSFVDSGRIKEEWRK